MAIPMVLNLDREGNCKYALLPKKMGSIFDRTFATHWFSVIILTNYFNCFPFAAKKATTMNVSRLVWIGSSLLFYEPFCIAFVAIYQPYIIYARSK
jgi:hypothetical protein